MARGPEVCTKMDAFDICICSDCIDNFKKNTANEKPIVNLLERKIKTMLDEVKKLRAENHAYKSRVARLENHIEASEKEEKEELAFYITNHRKALNISRDKLAVVCKVSDVTIRNMEHGEGNLLKMRELVKVMQGLRRV